MFVPGSVSCLCCTSDWCCATLAWISECRVSRSVCVMSVLFKWVGSCRLGETPVMFSKGLLSCLCCSSLYDRLWLYCLTFMPHLREARAVYMQSLWSLCQVLVICVMSVSCTCDLCDVCIVYKWCLYRVHVMSVSCMCYVCIMCVCDVCIVYVWFVWCLCRVRVICVVSLSCGCDVCIVYVWFLCCVCVIFVTSVLYTLWMMNYARSVWNSYVWSSVKLLNCGCCYCHIIVQWFINQQG